MCESLSFLTAKKWDKKKMLLKLGEIAELAEQGAIDVPEKAEDRERLQGVLASLVAAKGEFNVVDRAVKEAAEDEAGPAEDDADELDDAELPDEEEPPELPDGTLAAAEKVADKKAKKVKVPKKEKAAGRPLVMGRYSAGAFTRWLGRRGVTFEQASAILMAEGGGHLKPQSVRMELKEVREGHPAADVSSEDAAALAKRHPDAFKAGDV